MDDLHILPNYVKSLTYNKGVYYISQSGTSGYANAAKGYVYDLLSRNIPTTFKTFDFDETHIGQISKYDQFLKKSKNGIVKPYDTVIVHSTPDVWDLLVKTDGVKTGGKNVIGRTVWEYNILVPEWVNAINTSIVNVVSVPTNWNKEVFEKSGVVKPIIVEPHINIHFPYTLIDLETIVENHGEVLCNDNSSELKLDNRYKYYTIGQYTQRKGISDTIESFCKAFQKNDNVVLIVKTFGKNYSQSEIESCKKKIKDIIDSKPSQEGCAPIVFIKNLLTYDEINSLHDHCDCYVQLTKTEGVGLGILDAYNKGKKVIVTKYGGHLEFLPKEYDGFVDFELISAEQNLYSNIFLDVKYKWANANIYHAVCLLRNQYVTWKLSMKNKKICLGSGWHNQEFNSEKTWRWTTRRFCILIKDVAIDKILIKGDFQRFDNTVKVEAKFTNDSSLVELSTTNFKKDEPFNLEVSVTNCESILVTTKTFIPSKCEKSNDHRELGVMVYGIEFISNDKREYTTIDKIMSYNDDDTYEKTKKLVIDTDTYFSFPKTSYNSENIDNTTVVLTCHGDRCDFGKTAYKSIIDSGIKNVVIVVSGNNKKYTNWAENLKTKHKVIIIDGDFKSNNECWIAGLKASETKWSIILHDDDIMLPNIKNAISLLDESCLFGMWNGEVENFYTKNIELNNTLDIHLKTGKYNVNVVKDLIIKNRYSISPIHGVFPTNEYIKCLELWQDEYGRAEFYRPFDNKPNFVVGNDYFIWMYFVQKSESLFLYFKDKCTKCISHIESSTQIDLNLSESRFIHLYDKMKTIHVKNDIKTGIIFYAHQLTDGIKSSLTNINDYKLSKYDVPFVIYSDQNLEGINHIRFNKMEEMQAGMYRECDKYAFWAFVEGIKIAKEKNWDYFFCYEWDCKVGSDYWFDTLWQEHLAWPHEPVITGTPAVRFPKNNIGNFCQSLNEYSYNYSKQCYVSLNVDIASPISLYTNGALTFYNTKELCKYFSEELSGKIYNRSEHVDKVGPWDFGLGVRIFKNLKEDSFKRVGWLPSSYSGCGDFCYNQEQRDFMLSSKLKSVIHQYKY